MPRHCQGPARGFPDWRDAAAYQPLLPVEPPGLAWEWLRRDPHFFDAALDGLAAAEPASRRAKGVLRFGLHAWEDPCLSAPAARPVWAAPRHGWVVSASACARSSEEDCLELASLGGFATIIRTRDTQHLLLTDGYRSIRLDVTGALLEESPVRLTFLLSGIRDLRRPLIVLQRFRSLVMSGHFSSAPLPRFQRGRRIVTLLRAHDGLCAGATHAEIAEALLARNLDRRGWRIHSPSLRSQAQRLARSAMQMASGGFWRLLD